MKNIARTIKQTSEKMKNLYQEILIKSEKIKGAFVYLLFIFILLAVNMPVVVQMKMLRMGSDEYNILSIAAYMAGIDWSSYNASVNAYHGFGSAIIYVPLFWIFKNSVLVYKMALVENLLIFSIVPCISYYITRHYFYVKKIYSIFISICISIYPYYLISNKHTWSENFVILFTWLNLLLALKVFETWNTKHAIYWGVLYAFVAGYSYMVHGRCIVYVVLAILVIVISILLNRSSQSSIKSCVFFLFTFFIIICFMYILNTIIINFLKDNLWQANELRNTMDALAIDRLSYFTSWPNIMIMLKLAVGQVFYLVVVTMGMAILAFSICIKNIYFWLKSKKNEKMQVFISIYILFAYISSLVISILGLISGVTVGSKRSDYVIWGRHTEPLFPILILFVLVYCITKKLDAKIIRYSFYGILVCVIAFFKIGLPFYLLMDSSGHSSIVSILVWLRWEIFSLKGVELTTRFISVGIAIIIISALLLKLLQYEKFIIVIVICSIEFLFSYIYVVNTVTLPLADAAYSRVDYIIEFFEDYDLSTKKIYYASTEIRYPSELQIALGDWKVELLYDPLNPTDVKLSQIDWEDAIILFDSLCLDSYCEQGLIDIEKLENTKFVSLGDKKLVLFGEKEQRELMKQGVILRDVTALN